MGTEMDMDHGMDHGMDMKKDMDMDMDMDGGGMDDGGMDMDMDPGDMIVSMQMAFEFGYKTPPVLFQGFKVDSVGLFIAALLFIFGLSLVTEGLSFLIWRQKFTANKGSQLSIGQKAFSSSLYLVLRLLNYCQMLVAMTFNFWLILSIAIFQYIAWFGFQEIKDGMVLERETTKLLS